MEKQWQKTKEKLSFGDKEYVTPKQLCEICGICTKTAYNLERRGMIPYVVEITPKGRIHRIRWEDVYRYLEIQQRLYDSDTWEDRVLYAFFCSQLEGYPHLMRTRQVAEFTGFSLSAIGNWLSQGRLMGIPGRKGWNIPKDVLASFLSCSYCLRGRRKPERYRRLLEMAKG